jgi:hypothetical protein
VEMVDRGGMPTLDAWEWDAEFEECICPDQYGFGQPGVVGRAEP